MKCFGAAGPAAPLGFTGRDAFFEAPLLEDLPPLMLPETLPLPLPADIPPPFPLSLFPPLFPPLPVLEATPCGAPFHPPLDDIDCDAGRDEDVEELGWEVEEETDADVDGDESEPCP